MKKFQRIPKRLVGAALACVTAASLLASGTLAWTSFSQMAQNMTLVDGLDDSLIGARLRDDFDGANKDVYVENFGTQPVFVRVSLYEFAERGPEAGEFTNPGRDATPFISTANFDDVSTWRRHTHATATDPTGNSDATNPFREYWQWGMGGSKIYMPTFNRDQDCLRSDITGPRAWADANATEEYQAMVRDPQTHTTPDFDWDMPGTHAQWAPAGTARTAVSQFTGGENASVTQTSRSTLTPGQTCDTSLPAEFPGVVTMAWWLANGEPNGDFWVMDSDGWFYWASPLMPEEDYTVSNERRLPSTATSLLLSYIELQQQSDEPVFYVIHVNMQATSLEDLDQMGSEDGPVSDDARRLLDGAANMLTPPTNAANPGADTPAGEVFRDNNGVDWVVLHIDNDGNRLITTYREIIAGVQYHSAPEFVTLSNSDGARPALNAWWPTIDPALRAAARPAQGIDVDVHSAPNGRDLMVENGAAGMTSVDPANPAVTPQNTLFVLSVSEYNRARAAGTMRENIPMHGTQLHIWLRSPGLDSSMSRVVRILGTPSPNFIVAVHNTSVQTANLRPAMWIEGNSVDVNPLADTWTLEVNRVDAGEWEVVVSFGGSTTDQAYHAILVTSSNIGFQPEARYSYNSVSGLYGTWAGSSAHEEFGRYVFIGSQDASPTPISAEFQAASWVFPRPDGVPFELWVRCAEEEWNDDLISGGWTHIASETLILY